MVVTKARANLVQQLGGQPAMTAVQSVIHELDDAQRELLRNGLFIGCVRDEYRERFGRGDYLIRNVMAADEQTGAIAVGELMRVGQTVRLHVRDARTATEDLEMLLDAQKLHDRPLGAMLLTCNSRGRNLFGESHRDVKTVSRAFAPFVGGEEMAKGGEPIDSNAPMLPLAGFFAAGEIGPIGDRSYLHGHSACLALFRATRRRITPTQ
jgi:small ligand-binding sensory domain FIST